MISKSIIPVATIKVERIPGPVNECLPTHSRAVKVIARGIEVRYGL